MNNKPTNFVKVSSTEEDLSALASHFKARAETAEAEKIVAYDSGYAAGLVAAENAVLEAPYHDDRDWDVAFGAIRALKEGKK